MIIKLRESLGARGIFFFCSCLLIILSIMTVMNVLYQKRNLERIANERVGEFGKLVLTAMRYPMLEGDQEVIQKQFDGYKSLPGLVVAHLTDKNGIIRRSSDMNLIGEKPVSSHLEMALQGKEFRGIELRKRTGEIVVNELYPILNEKKCYACHGSKDKVLGVVRLALDWKRTLQAVKANRNWNFLLSGMGLVIMSLLIAMFFLRAVVYPIRKLEMGIRNVSQGNLDLQLAVETKDEIGSLTTLFNKMTGDLKILMKKEQKKKEELALLNINLNKEVTERKWVEEALRETKGYLENLFSYANAPIIVWDPDFVITRFNHAFEELTGIKAEEAIGKRLEILFPEESCETSMAMINKTLSGERWEVVEIPILHKSGEVRTVLWNSANVFGQDGTTIIATIAQGQDITERKKVEEAQKQLIVIIEATPDFVGFADAKDKHVVYINKAGRKMVGVDEHEDVTKLKIFDVHPEWTNKMFAEEILPVAVRDGTWTGECAFLNIKDRHEIPVLMVLSSYKAPNGEVEVFSTISRDITERKKIEGQLKNYSIELEKSNKELDDFTYIISHDLKEPLRSIDAFSGFVLDDYKDKLDAEGKNYLERIRVNANRMQELIEDLLDISRIERMRNPFEEIETRELVNEVKLRLEYAIKEKNLELIVPDNLPKIFCDRVRLTEVFANLVSNAIKFNDKPKPVIEIGCSEKDGFYEFYVKDNGPGIEEQYFEKIFEIFQRLGHRETAEGTGAGLTIVKKIVQMHKGKVWVESKVGEGTTFYFTIPLKAELIQGTVTKESFFTKEEVQKITDKG